MKFQHDDYYIARILKGDHSAYAYLIDKHKNMVYNISLKICRNCEDAEEIAQDSFIKAFHSLEDFQKKSKFSTWLYKIVYNTAISKTRKKRIITVEVDTEIAQNMNIVETSSVLKSLKHEEQKKYLREAMEQLDETDNLLLTLFYYDENSIEEINKITEITKTNIKIKLYRARKKLYVELEKILNLELKAII